FNVAMYVLMHTKKVGLLWKQSLQELCQKNACRSVKALFGEQILVTTLFGSHYHN
ncbi:hypothetical protein S245_052188, partial [Arachis hypogaea]